MTAPLTRAEWLNANGEFLSASVAWIRARLRQHAPVTQELLPASAPRTAPVAVEPQRRSRWGRSANEDAPTAAAPAGPRQLAGATGPATTFGGGSPTVPADGDITELTDAIDRYAQSSPPPALVALAAGVGLTRFERDVLLLCAAVELDPSIRRLCADVHGNPAMTYPTFALALSTLPDPAWEALSPDRGLREWCLIEINRPWGESLVSAALRTDERIVDHIKGLDHLDDRVRALVLPIEATDPSVLPASQAALAERIAGRWADEPVVQIVGPDAASSRLVASAAAARTGRTLYGYASGSLPTTAEAIEEAARLWRRECALSEIALCIDVDTAADDAARASAFVTRLHAPVIVTAREALPALLPSGMLVDVAPPTVAERRGAWVANLPADTALDAGALAAQFALDTASIARAAEDPDPWARCRALTRTQANGHSDRQQPLVGWDDLVLGETELRQLHAIADQVRHRWTVYEDWGFAARSSRGLGLSALFSGPSGVGKTLAAEVLAHELQLDLHHTDLSSVISKYIGETEKNLRALFDAAEAGGWLLFFDEADALFGKRSEVKEAHDRFANVQIDYLLQRMEAYQGLAILSTNLRTALDTAFLRRIRFIVEFPFPDVPQRRAIWGLAFPATVPGADTLDLDRLAELPVNGGMVRNIAMNAAFLAAAGDREVDMELVSAAVRDEFTKLHVPIRERDLTRLTVPA
jgi:hypothetical protein